MQILARTYHVAYGVPPRRFAVTFEIGGERHVHVASDVGRARQLQWQGRGYRPGSKRHLQAVVDRFLQLEASDMPSIERANAELLHPGVEGRESGARKERCAYSDDRQLPAGDRA